MNCLYYLKQTNLFRLLTLAIFGVVAYTVSAETVDLGELEFEKEYTIPGAANVYTCHVTAPKSGTLTYYNKNVSFNAYSDAAMTTEVNVTGGSYVEGARVYTFKAEAGQTYYFSYDNWMKGEGSFKVSMTNELKLSSTTVTEGSTISVGGSGNVEYTFNQSISVGTVTLAAGSNKKVLDATSGEYRVSGTRLVVEYASVLNDWYNNGTVAAGDEITISITGLQSYSDDTIKYNGDGNATFKYVAANKPITLVSATTADGKNTLTNGGYATCNFLSYFSADNANGKYVFTFSDAIDSTLPSNLESFAYLIWGENSEDGGTYQEFVPVTFSNDNKTITVDCTGKLRTIESMGGFNFGYITLRLIGIKSVDGQYAYTGTNANQGSYSFSFTFETVSSSVSTRFRPTDTFGTSENLTVQITGYDQVSFTGVKFAWRNNGAATEVVVDKADLTITEIEGNAASVVIAIPEAARTAKNVKVSFEGLAFEDGIDHSSLFTATYNVAENTVAENYDYETDPEELQEVEELTDVMISFTSHQYVYYNEGTAYLTSKGGLSAIALPTPTASKLANRMVQNLGGNTQNAGYYTITFPEGYFMFEDGTVNGSFAITLVVKQQEQGGSTDTPSELNITSTPNNGATVESCEEIDVIFNDYEEVGIGGGKATIAKDGGDAVELGDAGYGVAYNEAIQPLDGKADEEGTYVVSFPAGYFILDGDDSPAFTISFTVGASKALNVVSTPANGATVESCDKIELTFPDYATVSEGAGVATLLRRGDYELINLGSTNWGEELNQIVQPLGNNATTNGVYTVTFPAGYFLLGATEDDANPIPSSEFSIIFEVKAATSTKLNITSTPADGSTVSSCEEIDIIFDDYEEVAPSWNGKATIAKDGGEAVELGDASYGTAYNEVLQSLGNAAAEEGVYVVSFPEGYFVGDEAHNYDNLPAFTITFTVSKSTGVSTITVAGEGAAEYFNLNGVQVSNPTKGVFVVKRGNTVTKQVIK